MNLRQQCAHHLRVGLPPLRLRGRPLTTTQRFLMNRRALCGFGLLSLAAIKSSFASSMTEAIVGSHVVGQPLPPAKLLHASADDRRAYETFKTRLISPDGRVIDTFNGGVSHSEGQGWGMLMAVAFDDPEIGRAHV